MVRVSFLFAFVLFSATLGAAPPDARVERHTVERPDGILNVLVALPGNYWLDSQKKENIQLLTKNEPEPLLLVLHGSYSPDLLDRNGEPYPALHGSFRDFLHSLCYRNVDYEDPDYKNKQWAEARCYGSRTIEFFAGGTLPYLFFAVWGQNLERTEPIGFIRYPIVWLTMILFSVPQLLFYLLLLLLLRPILLEREGIQRAVKVILPLALGIGWLLIAIRIWPETGHEMAWYIAPFRFFFALSGVYFALTFIPCMWIADRVIFDTDAPVATWVIVLFYFLAPVLIFAGGAARGGSRSVATASSGGSSSGGGMRGGGGSFGGGGASGRY